MTRIPDPAAFIAAKIEVTPLFAAKIKIATLTSTEIKTTISTATGSSGSFGNSLKPGVVFTIVVHLTLVA